MPLRQTFGRHKVLEVRGRQLATYNPKNRQHAPHKHPAMSHPRIAIAGAGPAGLTLARILHLAGIPFTIYELDASKEHRYEQGMGLVLSLSFFLRG
jgi:NADPH-dependent 2,4-dienoyl-CoA reductase/sulfur reductase-like enzyme